MIRTILLAFLFTLFIPLSASAEKPEWAGKGKPTEEQKAAHREAMKAHGDDDDDDDGDDDADDHREGRDKAMEKQREMKSERVQKEAGKGSEQGQESREGRRKWWQFWSDDDVEEES